MLRRVALTPLSPTGETAGKTTLTIPSRAVDFLGDQDAIEYMCTEAGSELIDLEHMGVIFNRDDEGRLGTRAFGGQQRARTFFVSDFTGQAILHVLYEQLMKSDIRGLRGMVCHFPHC